MRYAMIMAGGAGTRLWPMSRKDRPKQLVPFIRPDGSAGGGAKASTISGGSSGGGGGGTSGGSAMRSLLQVAADRLEGLVPAERRYICTSEGYRGAIRAALPAFGDAQILGEPVGRDTVNAVGFAAAVLEKLDPSATFAVLTADHLIEPVGTFARLMDLGFRLVEQDPTRLVTFSIKPTYPATGFGYVERSTPITGGEGLAFLVERFVEKPSLQKAQAYIESGAFGWNSGMFVWRASTFMDCLRRYKPESYDGLKKIAAAWGTPDQQRVLNEVYPTLPKISVDYAIMEPASREQQRAGTRQHASPGPSAGDGTSVKVCTVMMDLTWLDVGSWPSFAQTLSADASGNRVMGNALLQQCRNSVVASEDPGHTVALLGCDDLIVVHTKDATLVMPRSKAEELKTLHGLLPGCMQ